MLPVLRAFLQAHSLSDVTVIADAGVVSEANKRAIEAAGLSFILGARVPDVPYVVQVWRETHPDTEIPDGHVSIQPWPAGSGDNVVTTRPSTSAGPTGPGAPFTESTPKSPRPRTPSRAAHRSNATATCA